MAKGARTPVLFVVEAVTLAQVVRLWTLAQALDPARYEIHFASARFDERIFGAGGVPMRRWPIRSLAPELVDRAVASGKRIYEQETLAGYVAEERALLRAVRPAVVVGDLRLSLAISAPLEKVPQVALINAYWSPHAVRDGFPLPDHPIVRILGERIAARYFPVALPKVFAHFARPVNALRRQHGLPAIGSLPEVMLHGDATIFPDVPSLVPTRGGPAHHHYLGPVLWAPRVPLPPWWPALEPDRPTVYVTMGSSGRADRLPLVLRAIVRLGYQAIVATAGRAEVPDGLPRVHAAELIPGDVAAARATVVVSNGGSTTGYQALAAARPVVGIASNLDQYLAMTAIEKAGAGVLLRAGRLDEASVAAALEKVAGDPAHSHAAAGVARSFAEWDSGARFATLIGELTATVAPPRVSATDPRPA
ncbi:MAG: nucleotide disphospho-sugar-binding domain-containing protein [Verrucomicrobiota bacterium]